MAKARRVTKFASRELPSGTKANEQGKNRPGLSMNKAISGGSHPPVAALQTSTSHLRRFGCGQRATLACESPAIYPHFAQISAAGDFMTIGGSKNVQLGLMLATVLSVSFWPAP